MTVETATLISDLNPLLPDTADGVAEGDNHIRLLKSTIQATFPSINAAVTATDEHLNAASFQALAGIGAVAADKLAYYTSTSAAALTTLSSFARSLLDDTDEATARATLSVPSRAEHRGYIDGLTMSNGPVDFTNDIQIAAGTCMADDGATPITLSSALVKRLDASFVAGSNNGGRDVTSIWPNDDTWHVFVILNTTTGAVDGFLSDLLSPTLPTGYTKKRRIGAVLRVSGSLLLFNQYGDYFWLHTPVLDANQANPGVLSVNRALTVPDDIPVIAIIQAGLYDATPSTTVSTYQLINSLSVASTAPTASLFSQRILADATATPRDQITTMFVETNNNAEVRSYVSVSNADIYTQIMTLGWIDKRGKDE